MYESMKVEVHNSSCQLSYLILIEYSVSASKTETFRNENAG